jgi:DNA-binding NtrC family response regulator
VTGGGPLILVVEDDDSLRLLCRVNLELDGFRVEEAATETAARAAIEADRPALVVLDLLLGAADAEALLDELRAGGVPVVLLSGAAELESYRDRATEVLAKPFEPSSLSAIAKRLTVG